MLIIAEGTDGTGKTTLLEQIGEQLDGDVTLLHRGVPQDHPLVEYENDLHDYVAGRDQHILCDRWHWGELIYGPLYRNESKLGGWKGAGRLHVELFLRSRGCVMLHVLAAENVVRDRLRVRGEDYLKDEDLGHTLKAFRQAASTTILPTIDVESPAGTSTIERVVRAARAFTAQVEKLSDFTCYVGHPVPRVLYVGETNNGNGPLPFVPMPSTSGAYLLDVLKFETFIGLTNALDEDVFGLWWTLRRPQVVALGRTAQKELERLKIPHGAAPHPQYVRRFHHSEFDRYREALRHAAAGKDVIDQWQR